MKLVKQMENEAPLSMNDEGSAKEEMHSSNEEQALNKDPEAFDRKREAATPLAKKPKMKRPIAIPELLSTLRRALTQ